VDTFETLADVAAFNPVTAPNYINVIGLNAVDDCGGGVFSLVGSEPASLTNGSTFHKADDLDGNWYERNFNGTIHSQEAGVFGDSTECSAQFNDLIEWVGTKGGGKIILPQGVVSRSAVRASAIPMAPTERRG
jgi:hypothetical protein